MMRPRSTFNPPAILTALVTIMQTVQFGSGDGLIYKTGCCPKVEVPDTAKRSADIIEQYNYEAEVHQVVTEDGYIISLHRVLPKLLSSFGRNPAVLVQHGIIASSALWLLAQEKSLPFLLSDAGFDVFLIDTRGNSYSNKHLYLTPKDPRYWQFSFHEMAYYDLPASVDYVLNITGNEKVFYVGHSRGTTMGFALLSSRPEYNDKFHLLTMYAPVAYLKNSPNPLLQILLRNPQLYSIQSILKLVGLNVLPGSSDSDIQFRQILCNRTQITCMKAIFAFGGFDFELLNRTMIPVYLSHYPEGGGIREFVHFLQVGISDRFQQFDYGASKNLEIYGSTVPPLYDLSKITAPVVLYRADNDLVVGSKDLTRLARSLPNLVGIFSVSFNKFSHSDFQWATMADHFVHRPAIEFMKQFLPPIDRIGLNYS